MRGAHGQLFQRIAVAAFAGLLLSVAIPALLTIRSHGQEMREQRVITAVTTTRMAALAAQTALASNDLGALDRLAETLARDHSEVKHVLMADRRGLVVVDCMGQKGQLIAALASVPSRPTTEEILGPGGERRLVVRAPVVLGGEPWGAVQVEFTLALIDGEIQRSAVNVVITGVLLLVVGFVAAARFARSLSLPLERLAKQAREIAQGNFHARSGYRGRDEIGVLAEALDQMTEQLALARRRSDEAVRLKSEFLANMSHEIRTPMNGVIGMSELLLTTELSDRPRALAMTLHKSARALLSLLNDILDYSKIEAGKLQLNSVTFDAREVVHDVAELLAVSAQEKGLALACRIPPALPLRLRGDADRLRQILINLVGNAVKFTDQGEVVVEASVAAAHEDDVVVRFEVRDTGPGISPEARARLFQPFTQVDATTTRRHGGTGLGLVIAKRLCELMGGDIGLTSDPGQGSVFWFTARFQAEAAAEADPHRAKAQALRNLRVLVVDDNATERMIAAETLIGWGLSTGCAASGSEALRMLRDGGPGKGFDLVLLDSRMPGMSGAEVVSAIRSDAILAVTPVIVLTAFREDWAAGNRPEVQAMLSKPLRPWHLLDALLATVVGAQTSRVSTTSGLARAAVDTSRRRPTVLVAEDNPVNQQVAVGFLGALGYEAEVVGTGREAVAAVEQRRYAIVLMDVMMPEMNGYAATAEIRRREGQGIRTPIIAMTASALEGDRDKAIAAGMDDFVAKPIDPAIFADVLSRWTLDRERATVASTFETSAVSRAPLDERVLAQLEDLDALKPGFFNEVVRSFAREGGARLRDLQAAILRGDGVAARADAHRLRGSAASVGATDVAEQCARLEFAAANGELANAPAALAMLEESFNEASSALLSRARVRRLPAKAVQAHASGDSQMEKP